jgi:hypothetical protein
LLEQNPWRDWFYRHFYSCFWSIQLMTYNMGQILDQMGQSVVWHIVNCNIAYMFVKTFTLNTYGQSNQLPDWPTNQRSGCSSRCIFTVRNLMSCNNTHCSNTQIWKTHVQLMWLIFLNIL